MNILYTVLLLCVVSHVLASKNVLRGSGKRKISALEPADEEISPSSNKRVIPLEQVSEEDLIASSTEVQSFMGAVKKGDAEAARDIFHTGNEKQKEYCGKYLISLGSHGLVKLINGAIDYIKSWMLNMALVYADQALFDEVSAETKPTYYILREAASSADLACKTDKFLYLLGKITDKGRQEQAVRLGVEALFHANKPEYLDPLLFALQNEPSLDPNLTNAAIQQAFWSASDCTDDRTLYVKCFFDHPAVSAEDYSLALRYSYRSEDPKHELFHWLLTSADGQDLEKVRSDVSFSRRPPEFRAVVNYALYAVIPGARIGCRHRVRFVILADAINEHVPTVILGLIAAYFDWQLDLF